MGIRKRVEEALAAGRKAVEEDELKLAQEGPGLAIVAFGSNWQNAPDREHLQSLRRSAQTSRRILITNSTNVDLYQLDGTVTEYVPVKAEMKDIEKTYCARKISVLHDKWNLQDYIAADPTTDQTLRELGIKL